MPNVAVGAVLFISTLIYLVCRYVFDCCGGQKSRPNFCWPNRFLVSKYSKGDLIRPQLFSAACMILCFAAMVWGVSNVVPFRREMISMRDKVSSTKVLMEKILEHRRRDLDAMLVYSATEGSVITTSLLQNAKGGTLLIAESEVLDVYSDMEDKTMTRLYDLVTRYLWAVYTLLIVTFFVSFCGFILSRLHCVRQFPMLVFILFWVLGTLVWLFFGYNITTHHILMDSCREVTYYNERKTNVLPALVNCSGADEVFTKYQDAYMDIMHDFANATCAQLITFCGTSSSNEKGCPSWAIGSIASPEEICNGLQFADIRSATSHFTSARYMLQLTTNTLSAHGGPVDGIAGRMASRSTPALTDSAVFHSKADILSRVEAFDRMLGLFAMGKVVSSCQGILGSTLPQLQSNCMIAVTHSSAIARSLGLLGLSIIVGLFAMALGSKRFLPLDMAFASVLQ